MINSLKEQLVYLQIGPIEVKVGPSESGGGDILATQTSETMAGFVFDREGLVRLLTECKYSNHKTVDAFLKHKGIKYL